MVSVLVYDREPLDYLAGPEKLDIGLASSLIVKKLVAFLGTLV